jgi:hypothetical protein
MRLFAELRDALLVKALERSVPDGLSAFLIPWKINCLLIHINTSGALSHSMLA